MRTYGYGGNFCFGSSRYQKNRVHRIGKLYRVAPRPSSIFQTMSAELRLAISQVVKETEGEPFDGLRTPRTKRAQQNGRQFSKSNPPPHGHYLRYYAYGCRCDKCSVSATEYARNKRRERYSNLDPDTIQHGTPNAYKNLGCRCKKCRVAMYEYQQKFGKPKRTTEQRERWNANRRAKRLALKTGAVTGVL